MSWTWIRVGAVAIPPVLASVAVIALAVLERTGDPRFTLGPPRNIAEAAGLGNGAEVLRLLWSGDDPRRVQPIRPEIISSSVRHVTALEAAVWSRRVELVRLLDAKGVIAGRERQHLACLARDLDARDITDYLSSGAAPVCVPDKTRAAILARELPAGS